MIPLSPLGPMPQARAQAANPLFKVAQELEASFLAEMLKPAGLGAARESFGGGAGEAQFASLLTQAHATALAESGGIGLAETIFEALKERANE